MSRLNLITSCTNSKHNNGHSVLNLATFSEKYKTPKGLIHAWGEAVNSALSTKLVVPVEKLYKGGHWSTAMSIYDAQPIELWVLSAGFGLLKHGDAIVPYQATFATGHKDSIPLFSDKYGKKSFYQEWWGKLNEASPLKKSHPVSLSDLMMDKSDEYFIICASPDYINAINMDLMKGISYLKDVDRQLIIISSSQAKFSLKKNLLVSNKSIAEFFNSNMLMLNIKIAQYVIEQFMSMDDGHLGLLAERLRSTFSVLPKKHTVRGVRRRPEEVTIWISSYIHANPDGSASRALRSFRDQGNSFEEKRFRTLYQAVLLTNR